MPIPICRVPMCTCCRILHPEKFSESIDGIKTLKPTSYVCRVSMCSCCYYIKDNGMYSSWLTDHLEQ